MHNREFVERATSGFDDYRAAVDAWTLDRAAEVTGVPADAIQEFAHAYALASTAQLCWTLGITEHHCGTDNVFSLINLALLTGHIGRWGSGLVPLRGQNNVQGGADMGALPNKLPGFKDVSDDVERARFEAAYGTQLPAEPGWHISQMFDAMERNDLRSVYIIGENPAQSEADATRVRGLLAGLDHLVVQDMFLTKTAGFADVVLPAAAGWAETDGTFTSSERRVQLVRRALDPPGEAKDDLVIIADLAARLGHDWGHPTAEELWDELRGLSAIHAGMSYERLASHGGLQWPCRDEDDPGRPFLHGRLWDDPVTGSRAPFTPVEWIPPVDELSEEYPIRLTTGRRLDSYNTGVQSGRYSSPKRWGESIDLSPEDAATLGLADGDLARVTSRRGSVEAPVRTDPDLRPGLAFMTFHFPDQVDTNVLTLDAWDPKSGTSEYKATAVRIEGLGESS
ncbi:formate dehydrogenase H [bacterium BMS3Abin02]|nr:formate dehydrogenase H [bacterium BMS3Abin02]